ncbi:MAG: hypothetical protein IJT60_02960 [Clostridia bacterium]|nr:hypothetical protein [Clostridia bacterium]
MRKVISCFFICLFTVSLLFSGISFPVFAEQHNMAEIAGIDYDRITQKAGGGLKTYPVELKLGDVTFNGELSADFGLTYDELNEIVNQVLSEKGLTPERVALVAKIASRAQRDAALYWGDQVLEGLLSYLEIPNTAFSVGDYYDHVVHQGTASAEKSAKIEGAKKAASTAIKEAAMKGGKIGKIGKIAKKASAALERIPLLGAIENTVLVADEWTSGNKRFDDYLELLEENLALINDFYATCSTRAVAKAESKDEQNSWVIKFDKRKNYRTYNGTFWGISGNMMSCTLSGELTGGKSKEGTYSGTLWLDCEAVDLSPVESNLENTPGLAPVKSLIYGPGGYKKVSDTAVSKTVLTREIQGELRVSVTSSQGVVRPEVAGSLKSGGDETTFSFARKIEWRDDSMAAMGAVGLTEATFSSSDVTSVTMQSSSRVTLKGEVKTQQDSTEVFRQDPGTIFKPLDAAPVITIRFS